MSGCIEALLRLNLPALMWLKWIKISQLHEFVNITPQNELTEQKYQQINNFIYLNILHVHYISVHLY